MAAAYLHIPFCEHICFYCDFNKVFLEGQPVDEYVDALIKEMQLSKQLHPQRRDQHFLYRRRHTDDSERAPAGEAVERDPQHLLLAERRRVHDGSQSGKYFFREAENHA